MFPAQLTGWVEAARAAAEIETHPLEETRGSEGEPALPRILSAGWLGTIAGLAACVAVGLTAWLHVNL
jgi:hypothetical protein